MLTNELYQRERHADFVREAEHARLLAASHPASPRPFYRPMLAALGVRLVDLGLRLQDNVETITGYPPLPAGE